MNNNIIVCTCNTQLSIIIIIVMGHSISPTFIILQCTSTVTKISLIIIIILNSALTCILQVDSDWSRGNYQWARESSNIAKILKYIGVAIGIVFWIIGGLCLIGNIVFATSNALYYGQPQWDIDQVWLNN